MTKLDALTLYTGVGLGILISAIVGILLTGIIQGLSISNPEYASIIKPLMEAMFGVIAIAMLSWMLIWMTQQAQFLKQEVEGAVTTTLKTNNSAAWGVFILVLIAVLREGFETVLFILAQFQSGLMPVFGAIAGLVVAIAIGIALFQLGVKINIRLFFQIMGVLLLLIVSGLVISALGDFDVAGRNLSQISPELSICFKSEQLSAISSCILGPLVWNVHEILPDKQFPGIILKTLFGYKDKLYLVQAVSYLLVLVTIGTIYFQSLGGGILTKAENSTINRT